MSCNARRWEASLILDTQEKARSYDPSPSPIDSFAHRTSRPGERVAAVPHAKTPARKERSPISAGFGLLACIIIGLFAVAQSSSAATLRGTGGHATGANWSQGANWDTGNAPVVLSGISRPSGESAQGWLAGLSRVSAVLLWVSFILIRGLRQARLHSQTAYFGTFAGKLLAGLARESRIPLTVLASSLV